MQINSLRILLTALTSIVFFLFSSCTKELMDDTEVLQAIQLNASTSKTVTLAPIQDAYLQGSSRYNSSDIRLEENNRQGYLMFDLSNINGSITAASLEFTVGSDPGHGTVKAYVGNGASWTETNLSTQNRPSTGAFLGSINKSYASGASQKITLNTSSLGKGKTSLILMHSNGNDLNFSSGETSKAPKLTITYSGGSSSGTTASKSFAIAPVQDAYLQGGTRYNSSIIRLEGNNRQGYLMFDLSNISGQITSASLQFTISSDPGNGTIKAYLGNGTSWTETNLSTRNKPSTGALLGSIHKSYSTGAVEKISLNTSSINKGKISLVLVHSNGNDLAFSSGETFNAPKLLVTHQGSDSSDTSSSSDSDYTNGKPSLPAKAYYVTPSGTANNSGKSESSAWSLEHAFSEATAGDVIFIKAGNYNNPSPVGYSSGNPGNPIKFIGYRTTPYDINTSGFKYGEALSASKMPLLKGASASQGFGIDINGSYIEIQNIQITNYEIGVNTKGKHVSFKNVAVTNAGVQGNNNSQSGRGFQVYGDNSILENCFVLNSTGEGINIKGGKNCTIRSTSVYSDNTRNPTGYYILLSHGASNCVVENSIVYRDKNAKLHRGHGFVLKGNATNNIVRNSKSYNTGIETNFAGVYSNRFENIQILGSYSSDSGDYSSSIRIMNGSHDNVFKNISVNNSLYGINFVDFDDGYTGASGDRNEGGHNNQFINVDINNVKNAVTATSALGSSSKSNNNTFTNCSFTNVERTPFLSYKDMNGTRLISCTFQNIPSYSIVKTYKGGSFPINFENCSYTSVSFSKPN